MIYAIAAVLVLLLDQGLKYWVTVNIPLDSGSVDIIPGILELVNIHNTGAAFGMLQGGGWRWVFVLIALAFIVVAVVAIKRGLVRGAIGRWAVVGMLAGAIGNCIDRVLYGYVVDMFKPSFLEGTVFGAIFNVADIFISCCGILFCLYILFGSEYKTVKPVEEDRAEEQPVQRRRVEKKPASGVRTGGSHAKGPGNTRRVPAREARSERPVRPVSDARPAAEQRTRIPVQQPRPQRRAPQQARPVDPSDPFAEWEQPARQAAPVQSAPAQSVPEPAPEAREPRRAPAANVGSEPAGGHEFTLEEILAEFSDK